MGAARKSIRRSADNTVARKVSINLNAADVERLAAVQEIIESGTGSAVTMSKLYSVALALLQMRLLDSSASNALWLFRV